MNGFPLGWIDRFYTHFIGRDLSCIFAGSIVLCCVDYGLSGGLRMIGAPWLVLIWIIVGSYFVGLGVLVLTWEMRQMGRELARTQRRSRETRDTKPVDTMSPWELLEDWSRRRAGRYVSVLEKHRETGSVAILDIERSAFIAVSFLALRNALFWGVAVLLLLWAGRWYYPTGGSVEGGHSSIRCVVWPERALWATNESTEEKRVLEKEGGSESQFRIAVGPLDIGAIIPAAADHGDRGNGEVVIVRSVPIALLVGAMAAWIASVMFSKQFAEKWREWTDDHFHWEIA